MSLYVDSSAFVKRYVAEDQSDQANTILLADREWVCGQHLFVEVSLALARRLDADDLRDARDLFERDWERTITIDLDEALCRRAVELGSTADARSLDSLHLAAAERAGGRSLPIVTFDVRLARAARTLGFAVIGA